MLHQKYYNAESKEDKEEYGNHNAEIRQIKIRCLST